MIMQNFPFTPGEFYEHDDIWPKLKIGNRGGIRPSNEAVGKHPGQETNLALEIISLEIKYLHETSII